MRSLANRLDLCSINTATLGHREPLHQVIDRVARAGFGGIAPWRHEMEHADKRAIARQLRALDLKVTGYCRSTYIPAADTKAFLSGIGSNRAAIHDAAELQAECFMLVVGGLPDGSTNLHGARRQVAEGIAMLLETAAECHVKLAIEPLHPMYAADRSVVNTLAQALALCDELDPDRRGHLGVAFDIFHCWWDPLVEATLVSPQASGRIVAFHVSDWLRNTRDMLLDRGMMGDGVVQLRRLRELVERTGFEGLVEVEIFSRDDWWQRPADDVLSTCAERLQAHC